MSDPYKILGVAKTASADEIRTAFRKLAKQLHPDANPNDARSEDRFKQVNDAFRLLSDPEKRKRYDRGEIDASGDEVMPHHHFSRARGQRPGGGEFTDIFSDLFSDFGSRQRPQKGGDIAANLKVDFATAAKGGTQRIRLPEGRQIEVKIPAGTEDGKVLRVTGKGQAGPNGGPSGDLLITIAVGTNRWFSRDGLNIRLDLPISPKEAMLGAKVRVPTLHGPVDVKIPAGSNTGTLLRLKGQGIDSASKSKGDQIVRLLVDLPDDKDSKAFWENWTPPAGYNPRKSVKI